MVHVKNYLGKWLWKRRLLFQKGWAGANKSAKGIPLKCRTFAVKQQFVKLLKFIAILPIRLYQGMISPMMPPTCRHEPTCSTYTVQAIREWGPLRGWWLGLKRLARCHPWGGWGYDPVPPNPARQKKRDQQVDS